jgi:uncharacterized membrane protein (TIGR02234 family)
MTAEVASRGRRTFVPALALGLASSALAAVSSNKTWVAADAVPAHGLLGPTGAGTSPLAGALALVVLAGWGVLLVTRGGFRRLVAWICLIASVGFAVAVVWGWWSVADAVRDEVRRSVGASGGAVSHTLWWWAALAAAVVVVVAGGLAVRFVGEWPEMGSRYDAPGEREGAGRADPGNNLDMWKALDEGHDPTA